MTYSVKLFAALKEKTGQDQWSYPSDPKLNGLELLQCFFDAYPEISGLSEVTRLAVNQAFCDTAVILEPSDEIALIPPVSGG